MSFYKLVALVSLVQKVQLKDFLENNLLTYALQITERSTWYQLELTFSNTLILLNIALLFLEILRFIEHAYVSQCKYRENKLTPNSKNLNE